MFRYESGFQDNEKPKVLIIGDSMAANLVNVLSAAGTDSEIDLATVNIGGNCKSLFGLNDVEYGVIYGGASSKCKQEHANALANSEKFESADTIVLASYFWEANQLSYLNTTAAYLKDQTNARIKVLGLNVQSNNGIWFVSKHAFSPQADALRTPPHPNTAVINTQLQTQASIYDYFDLLDLFCNASGCQRVTEEGYAIIFDDSHFSENGAKLLAQRMKETDWYKELLSYK